MNMTPQSQLRAAALVLNCRSSQMGKLRQSHPASPSSLSHDVTLVPRVRSRKGRGRFQVVRRAGGRLSIRPWGPASQHRNMT